MAGSPERPAEVPVAAVWIESTEAWELGPTDSDQRKHGLHRAWRADGTLRSETSYDSGEPSGVARRFHPDGSVAREMLYVAGQLDGTVIARSSDGPAPEPLQSCCVPANAWEMRLEYQQGAFVAQRWYDRAGAHLLPSGKAHPPTPVAVPPEARFDEDADRWIAGAYNDKAEMQGVWRRWSREGVLLERDEYAAGKAHGCWQRFLPTGQLLEEAHFHDGERTGPYRQTNLPAGRYPDRRISDERGAFERNQAVGEWTLHDDDGAIVRRGQLGLAVTAEQLAQSPALAAQLAPGETWASVAEALEAQGRIGEAILAGARGAAKARSADDLRLILAQLQFSLSSRASVELADQVMKAADGQPPLLVNGLARGGDAARLLRALAAAREGADDVALDLVDAALLLDPQLHECKVTRALIRLHRGHPIAARIDAEGLPAEWAEQRDFLLGYGRALYPVLDFWPTKRPIATQFTDIPEQPDQSLEAVQAQIRKYATRLMAIRAATTAALRTERERARPWLIPDLSALLPDGPVSLEVWEFEEIVVEEDGSAGDAGEQAAAESAPTLVKVDETLPLEGHNLNTLLRLARQEWNALCWLCWSAGLDRVAMPTTLSPPADFGKAAGMTVERLWRCRDKLATGGMRALSQGAPGFEWEGTQIDAMQPVLVEIVTLELLEVRALFFWLCDSGVQSPWQDNLRSSD